MQDGFDTVQTRFTILGAISFSHFLNDMIQSLIVAIYPLLKSGFRLSFVQIGAITLTYQICASVLQPLIGAYTDKHPKPHSLSAGMGFTLIGLVTLALAPNYAVGPGGGRIRRRRLGDLSPRVLAHRPPRLRRAPRSGAVDIPSRRQRGQCARAAARRLDHHAARAERAWHGSRRPPCWRSRSCGT